VSPSILLVYLAVACLWGSTWFVVSIGLEHLPPLLFAGVRMAIAAALLMPVGFRHAPKLPFAVHRRIVFVGVLQIALPYGLLFVAQQWVPSSLSAVLFATFPVWIALLSRFFVPGERLDAAAIAAVLLGVAGIVVLEWPHLRELETSRQLALGSALVVLASIVVAVANVVARRHLVEVPPLVMTAGQTSVGAIALLAAAALLERGQPAAFTPAAWGALLYLAVFGTVLTYAGLYWLLPRVSMAAIGAIPLLDTMVAVLLGAAVLRERLGWHLAVGGAMVLVAAALANRPRATAPA